MGEHEGWRKPWYGRTYSPKDGMDRTRIKDMPRGERPRERLARHGGAALSTSELLAILIRVGRRGETALDVANRLQRKYANLKALLSADVNELSRIPGMGFAKAVQLKAVLELAKRLDYPNTDRFEISTPKDVAEFLMPKMKDLDKEQLTLLCLDTRCGIIDNVEVVVSVGSLNLSIMDPRGIFRVALAKNADSVIIAHNHPSGDPDPSDGDVEVTKKVIESGKMLGVEVRDHVVIGDGKFFSMKEKGLI
ncbi:MAG: DNA repair protein RadC [Candidatus Hydrothermarchaeales archaeon]